MMRKITQIQKRQPGLVASSVTNELADAVNSVLSNLGQTGEVPKDSPIGPSIPGVIVNAPEGKEEFSDHRYWVQLERYRTVAPQVKSIVHTDADKTWDDESPLPVVVAATNLPEAPNEPSSASGL